MAMIVNQYNFITINITTGTQSIKLQVKRTIKLTLIPVTLRNH